MIICIYQVYMTFVNDFCFECVGHYGMSIVCKDNYLYTLGGTQGFDYTADIYR